MTDVVLKGFVETEEDRSVRWDPAQEPLLALLDGTNAWATLTILKVLAATELDREFREASDSSSAGPSAGVRWRRARGNARNCDLIS